MATSYNVIKFASTVYASVCRNIVLQLKKKYTKNHVIKIMSKSKNIASTKQPMFCNDFLKNIL